MSAEMFSVTVREIDSYAAFTLDSNGCVTSWNRGASRIFGYSEYEALGSHLANLLPVEDHAEERAKQILEATRLHGKYQAEGWRVRKSGERFWINATSTLIRNQQGKLESYVIIGHEVPRERIEAREEALQASRAKTYFVANMSHEIRTPIHTIHGIAYLLRQTPLSDKQVRYAETISQACDLLLSVVEGVLDFSKIEEGKLSLRADTFKLRLLVEECIDLVSHQAIQKGLQFLVNIDPTLPEALEGDATRIKQVLVNLLSNAVKFSEKGDIELTISAKTDHSNAGQSIPVEFQVRDHGVGIPETAQHRVFEQFWQLDSTSTRKHSGTGLGLVICKSLVKLMGGQIGFQSEKGEGTRFFFTLPLRAGQGAVSEQHSLDLPAFEAKSRTKDVSILVAEDNPVNQEVTAAVLISGGYRVDVVNTGMEVLERIRNKNYDVLLLDCQMPLLDGYETAGMIRTIEQAFDHKTCIIALTAHASTEDRAKCLDAGMDDYLSKPVDPKLLYETIERWVVAFRDQPKSEETPAFPSVNPLVLDRFKMLDPDVLSGLVPKLIGLFLSNTPIHLERLAAALKERDLETVSREAHSLKSACGSIGASRLACLAMKLEALKEPKSPLTAEKLLAEMRAEWSEVRRILEGKRT